MNGWYDFYHLPQEQTLLKKLYQAWLEWGNYQRAKIDHRSSSPVLAAVPYGENWDYLQDKPGVWLVEPTDVEAMKEVIAHIATAKFSGSPLRFDRSHLKNELSYQILVQDYLKIFDSICSTATFTNYQL
jgi:hypothetical protein